tara:strand:- start:45710 stop:46732 length:1023 start_codon:yes stop_codon:yes gene_type:complete
MNNSVVSKILKYLLSIILTTIIIYFLFEHQDPAELVNKLKTVEFNWIVLSMIFGACAYVSRGLRWKIMLEAINYKTSNINNIAAVSIGYFTNLFVPRAGEITRCTALNQKEKIPLNKLFGTIIVERLIDFMVLIFLLLFTLIIKYKIINDFYLAIKNQNSEIKSQKNILLVVATFILLILFVFLFKKKIKKLSFYNKIKQFLDGLKEGFKSVGNIKNKTLFWIHTLIIWLMYFLMTYVCFFSMNETNHLSLIDGVFILVLGGIGMVIPTPGGIGSYHAIVMIGLAVLGIGYISFGSENTAANPALIFPTIVHIAQTLVAIIMGVISLLILFIFNKKKSND